MRLPTAAVTMSLRVCISQHADGADLQSFGRSTEKAPWRFPAIAFAWCSPLKSRRANKSYGRRYMVDTFSISALHLSIKVPYF
eukprot:SAG31_NODE_14887_length_782_cov_0.916545_1_plen_82_part_10